MADCDLLRKHQGADCVICLRGRRALQAILSGDMDGALHEVIKFYIDTFGRDNYFIELQELISLEEAV